MSQETRVRVELDSGEQREIPISSQHPLLTDLLAANGLPLNTRCGQQGLCRGCEVHLKEGSLVLSGRIVSAPATVQACRTRLTGPVTLLIPRRSRMEHKPLVCDSFEITIPYAHDPLFEFVPGQGDTGFAVDVGTTTVAVLLVDLATGEVLSRASGFNAQIGFGDNVITRIEAARDPANLAALQSAIVAETIKPLLIRACELAGRQLQRIAGGAIAGNTTMLHLLVGEDPTPIGVSPFTPRFIKGRRLVAKDIKFVAEGLSQNLSIQLLPGIAAYIGADITAGVFATGMAYDQSPSLFVDIGTNGEIVLQNGGELIACSTAAGPAFEGCGLQSGARARDGVVSDFNLTLDPFGLETETIGNVLLSEAEGLCGSAYVDFLATARNTGLLGETGRFEQTKWKRVPAPNRFEQDGELALRLTPQSGSGNLRISEADIALLLQVKAAIGAGIDILLNSAGIRAADLGRVYLAGGFGMHLNVAHAIAIGLLPGIREQQVRVVGNTALAGTLMALLDRSSLEEMEALRERVKVIELNLTEDFENCYIEHLTLP
jgi:uncharacterized 2Fe-2S/4Fe-4S cluster protein (DUF4445 family)